MMKRAQASRRIGVFSWSRDASKITGRESDGQENERCLWIDAWMSPREASMFCQMLKVGAESSRLAPRGEGRSPESVALGMSSCSDAAGNAELQAFRRRSQGCALSPRGTRRLLSSPQGLSGFVFKQVCLT